MTPPHTRPPTTCPIKNENHQQKPANFGRMRLAKQQVSEAAPVKKPGLREVDIPTFSVEAGLSANGSKLGRTSVFYPAVPLPTGSSQGKGNRKGNWGFPWKNEHRFIPQCQECATLRPEVVQWLFVPEKGVRKLKMQNTNLEIWELFSESKVWKEGFLMFSGLVIVYLLFPEISVSGGCFYVLYLPIYSFIWGLMCTYL